MIKLNGLLICVSKEEVRMVIELLPDKRVEALLDLKRNAAFFLMS